MVQLPTMLNTPLPKYSATTLKPSAERCSCGEEPDEINPFIISIPGNLGMKMRPPHRGQDHSLPYLRVELLVEVSGLLLSLDEVQHLPAARGEKDIVVPSGCI